MRYLTVQQTIVPSSLQLSVMASQMLIISPQLSLIAALVIPAMALAVGCLGEKLRAISNDANLSAASLAAYLNEGFHVSLGMMLDLPRMTDGFTVYTYAFCSLEEDNCTSFV